jgi:hypothetical protein
MRQHNITPDLLQNEQDKGNKLNVGNCSFAEATKELADEVMAVLSKQATGIPLDVLPAPFHELIRQLKERYKFPADSSLLYLLFAFSIATGNNFWIRVKLNWIEPAILYLALVALAGQTKTPVQSFFTRPFKEKDRTNFDDYTAALRTYETEKQAATKANPFSKPKPVRQQLLIQDYTPEALVKVLSGNWRGSGVMMDELAGFFGNMNRYNSGNEVPMWLSFYNAQAFSCNRKTSEDTYVAHPFVSVIGGIQPGILKKIFAGDMQINGMVDRFLFVYNANGRKEVPGDEEIDASLIECYFDAIKLLLAVQPKINDADGTNEPRILDLTSEGKALLFDYLRANAVKVNELNDEGAERLAGMFSKYDYQVIRLSLLIQVITDASIGRTPNEVTRDAVHGAIRLADYFKQHTTRVQELISNDPLAAYDETYKALYYSLPDSDFSFSNAVATGANIRKVALDTGEIQPLTVKKWVQRFLQKSGLFNQPRTGHYIKKVLKG